MDVNWIWYLGLGYLLGSIPFALVIGKVFYKTDVRNFGSGNLGGTNAGRVLGKKAGISVILCDVFKVVLAVAIVAQFDREASIWAGLAAAIGHCYPVFAGFHGGKAVATMFGFLLSTSIFTFGNLWYVLVPLIFFLIVLYLGKMVSLASMVAAIVSSIYITIMQYNISFEVILASWLLTVLVIYRHRGNIVKIKNGTENKISWL
ncbi:MULTISPECIES: glycerol-3-phosphate 1-O-acyltransferase PlsY [Bacillota]|jgi:glycerol-3-phosphate acyltransferase PlsY|uniref:Glycerol-3-phosphate acyltransferase n=2 Tax=Amedibacillus TaxID=2749846 RepID=A0A7G9GM82_9FIRM|nr:MULTISPECIES: glycerol-3-phosphate 1-O-acyltransferase PlsY [Bacillota]QNM11914.1 glycerol-3-phosphate 1-O-acyltransferase PlsY [[Eubacterium] hominis]MCH4287337.1 glycerol-3-phosphate 1-O-acyltransferase PlsY [Amedibacillus hominis]RGB50896.1 glycerol-3-phosphate 1-O-acyltransferase [Absiella sp. AM22-9]RGB56391.1 glycerol-3-phosphate 1-O-acyltransferase [Absiella sp. AM10-20]RGB62482.1 glycerol-3-phosphate 1-O-acyltransferase [Absiella sp. AM09-45]